MKAQDIIQLRQLLAERFPHARTWTESAAPKTRACWPTGLAQMDDLLQGGLPKGAITELVSGHSASGSALLLHALLRQAAQGKQLIGLVDGQDSFDASALPQPVLSRLLWVRCKNAEEAMKAVDILLRDRNLPVVLLDLKINPAGQLRKIAGTVWFRLQRIVQQTSTAFLVITPQPMVSSTDVRLSLDHRFSLSSLLQDEAPDKLITQLKLELTRWSFGETSTESKIAG